MGGFTLNRIAQSLDTTPDFLIDGTLHDKAGNSIRDTELLNQFCKEENLPEDKKRLNKEFLDAFLFKKQDKQQLAL